MHVFVFLLGMGRFPDSFGVSAKKLTMRCIGYKLAFVSRCIVSNIFALLKNDLFINNYYWMRYTFIV